MIICETYDEARLAAIEKISCFDARIAKITITYDKTNDQWIIDNENFDDDEWSMVFM